MSWNDRAYALIHPIYKSTLNYGISEYWLAGLISVENANIEPSASRFEKHVYNAMVSAQKGIQSKAFPGFSSGKLGTFIKTATDQDLQILSTSWGVGQIMGYHYYNKWGIKPNRYKSMGLRESIECTLRMMADGLPFARASEPSNPFKALMRWWNTGSAKIPADGIEKTYSPNYLKDAQNNAQSYKAYLLVQEQKG